MELEGCNKLYSKNMFCYCIVCVKNILCLLLIVFKLQVKVEPYALILPHGDVRRESWILLFWSVNNQNLQDLYM